MTGNNRILVVDDNEINVELLVDALSSDYDVSVALDGETALSIVKNHDLDLILLDIMMPGIDGYEVCRRLKASPDTCSIPIIFLTALNESSDEARGLHLGAIDYITKPLNTELVQVRIKNHLALQEARQKLQEYSLSLEQLVEQKTQALHDAHERLKMIDATRRDYVRVIAHELRTPISGILGVAQFALEEIADPRRQTELTDLFKKSRWRLESTIDNALHLANLQDNGFMLKTEPLDLCELLHEAADVVTTDLHENMITEILYGDTDSATIHADRKLLLHAISTLLKLMIRLASPATKLSASIQHSPQQTVLKLKCSGKHLPSDVITDLFDECSDRRLYTNVQDLGFAIPLADKTVRAFGGQIYLLNTENNTISLSCIFENK